MSILRRSNVLLVTILLISTLGFSVSIKGSRNTRSMLGGYKEVTLTDERVVEAATFAVNALPALFAESPDKYTFGSNFPVFEQGTSPSSKLNIVVLEASEQVVAGLNFKVTIGVYDGENLLGSFKAVIYNHFDDLSVTTWGEELSSEDVTLLRDESNE